MAMTLDAENLYLIPAVINCDQGGGTITLDCTLSNKEND